MSILKELKNEISKVARREINKELATVKRVNAKQRSLIANLRRDLTELQKEINRIKKAPEIEEAVKITAEKEENRTSFWITGKGIKSLRSRLGLTQADLAKLADVTVQAIVRWEKTEGKINFRKAETAAKMQTIRGMGKRDIKKALGKPKKKSAPKTAKKTQPAKS